ncbi:MAG: copper amine oxidase N-terminal domain-containing protein [Clostridiales bacterium]|nr:copper amine oxidase N-terminal domain-containing protein [Clostridiales bacterium]
MKKLLKILTVYIGVLSAVSPAFGSASFSYSSSNEVSINPDSDFQMENIYYYSSADKSAEHTAVFEIGKAYVKADGEAIIIDEAPYISQGRTMLPLRAAAETLKLFENNINISWDSGSKKASVIYGGNEIVFTADSKVYTVNGESRTMEGGTPEITNSRVFITLRTLADAMELNIVWDNSDKTITITNS